MRGLPLDAELHEKCFLRLNNVTFTGETTACYVERLYQWGGFNIIFLNYLECC